MACERCGGEIVEEPISAKDILSLAKGAWIEIVIEADRNEMLNQMFARVLHSMDLMILESFGDEELIVAFCAKCSATRYCDGCGNPLIMNPERERRCVFCGA